MSVKKWIYVSLSVILTVVIANIIFLLVIDTYSIRGGRSAEFYTVPNQKNLIVEYILNNKKKYDTFIFGSSRVGNINPLKMKDKDSYNMTYGEGIPREHLLILKLFLDHGVKIKHVLMGLDEFSYQVSFKKHQNQFIPKSHYLATGSSILSYYKYYFFRKIDNTDIKHFENKYIYHEPNKLSSIIYNAIYNQRDFYENTKYENKHNDTHNSDKMFLNPILYSGNTLKDTLDDIKQIVELSKKYNFQLDIFINPIHHTTYKYTNQKLLKEFKEKLSYITPYYDFSIPNRVTNDNGYWLETSHYDMDVGELILNRIYDNNQSIENFGLYVEKKNF